MELLLLLLISATCLLTGVAGNQAVPLPSEIYWKNKLPDTPMPTLLHHLLHPAADQEGKTSTHSLLYMFTFLGISKHATAFFQSYTKNLQNYTKNLQNYTKNPPLDKNTTQLIDNPGASLFFLEKDLYPGAKMNLHFVESTASETIFLPQKLAKVIPFSSSKLPEILEQFAINPKSKEAEFVSQIIGVCEQPPMENEEKYCATSFESLVEYGTSKFGKNVDALATEIARDKGKRKNVNALATEIARDKGKRTGARKQQYVVDSEVRQIVSDNLVVCHSLPYLYAVFYCHSTEPHTAQAYVVPLVGADGTEIKAMAVCHKDTSQWDPDHVAFRVVKVKPGTVPICHFLTEDNIAWAAKNKDN